jgi:hypothetical protein
MGFLKKIGIHDSFPTTKKAPVQLPEIPNVSIQTNAGKANTEITMTNESEKNEMIGSMKENIFSGLLGVAGGITTGYFIHKYRSKQGKKGLFVPYVFGVLGGLTTSSVVKGVLFLWKNR